MMRWQRIAPGLLSAVAFGGLLAATPAADASINLQLRASGTSVDVGETFEVVLFAVSDSEGLQGLSAVDAIIEWDPSVLELLGVEASASGSASFPSDPFGLNEANPPADGDGIIVYLAPFDGPVLADPDGTAIATMSFRAVDESSSSSIGLLAAAGKPTGNTRVLDGEIPGLDVTGELKGTKVQIIDCFADLNDDGVVGFFDLLTVIGNWGPCPAEPEECSADFNDDDDVGNFDLITILANWGPCPGN